MAFSNTREILSLLLKGRYFRRMVTLETGYGITQVVKASVTISQNTIQDYTQPEDQFPVSTHLGEERHFVNITQCN